jgi:hypothetical protein
MMIKWQSVQTMVSKFQIGVKDSKKRSKITVGFELVA